ncbi:polysaccharide pyruvyl transferase family protein [Leucobacter allii]|uniref:Polysaccharide pyruvyl transferase family protein n=1 Tax=Leucobacter allii TaxID=2932247 RepID=A0ABY4FN52_9MICO|nr:polysaccharide pyruvyl transferase family protein [Leucobacter allii]UOQ57691.1 polysaccharide pyruvyl transferase family protein [Leucobacter allii]UOR02235.1 polysaccharide pyruvyl transferase family protein [Leucobacter allii]
MKCVVIGDVGWRSLYHLGDEAMTEAAVGLLQRRGVTDITVVAGHPEVTERMYGVATVKRIGFLRSWGREKDERVLARLTERLERGEAPHEGIYAAIADADFAVIAGGGNMNSSHIQHLYERLAFTRIAKHFGTPLFVTSQTVGPSLRPVDRAMVQEILDYAVCFGAREATTYAYLRTLTDDPEKVVHTLDDAALLSIDDAVRAEVDALGLPERFIIASFTDHPGTTALGVSEYRRQAAELLDELVERHDVDVVLVPHNGTFEPGIVKKDCEGHDAIVAASRTGRLRAMPMLMARVAVEITRRSLLSLSTRYHPTVFGPQVLTPTASISLSYYSSVRMRGSLGNVGLERCVVPVTEWRLAADACSELLSGGEALRRHLERAQQVSSSYQESWWDAIVAGARTGAWRSPGDIPEIESYVPEGEWSREVELLTPLFDRFTQEAVWLQRAQQDLRALRARADARENRLRGREHELRQRIAELQGRATELEQRATRSENRKSARVADALGRFGRRLRRG